MNERPWRRAVGLATLVALLALLAGACAEGKLEPRDQDDDRDSPREMTEEVVPTVDFAAGGGADETKNFRAEVSVGTPVPTRRAESDNYQIRMTTRPVVEAGEVETDE